MTSDPAHSPHQNSLTKTSLVRDTVNATTKCSAESKQNSCRTYALNNLKLNGQPPVGIWRCHAAIPIKKTCQVFQLCVCWLTRRWSNCLERQLKSLAINSERLESWEPESAQKIPQPIPSPLQFGKVLLDCGKTMALQECPRAKLRQEQMCLRKVMECPEEVADATIKRGVSHHEKPVPIPQEEIWQHS